MANSRARRYDVTHLLRPGRGMDYYTLLTRCRELGIVPDHFHMVRYVPYPVREGQMSVWVPSPFGGDTFVEMYEVVHHYTVVDEYVFSGLPGAESRDVTFEVISTAKLVRVICDERHPR